MITRTKIAIGISGAVVVAAGVVAINSLIGPTAILGINQAGCYRMGVDAGIGSAPCDARVEAGSRLYRISVTGTATVAPLTVQVFDLDWSNKIAEFTISSTGAWSHQLVLALGWHKLIFRSAGAGKTWDTVQMIGLAESAPTWTSPAWNTELDGGGRCWEMGCVPVGNVPRCGGSNILCQDGGCLDALHAKYTDPLNCKRGCGALELIPDAGCNDAMACPGYQTIYDAGMRIYKPRCCTSPMNVSGWSHTPAYSRSGIVGRASDIANAITSGSKATLVSNNGSGDKGKSIILYGFDPNGHARLELVNLNSSDATTPVTGVMKWGALLGAKQVASLTGTVTITSTTGGQTVMTLAGTTPKGLSDVRTNRGELIGGKSLTIVADAATTAQVAFIGGPDGFDGLSLNGTTPVQTFLAFNQLDYVVTGGLADALSLTISSPQTWCANTTVQQTTQHPAQGMSLAQGQAMRRGDALLNINFSGIRDEGCGVSHVLITMSNTSKPWPPPPLDGGYSYDAARAAIFRKYDWLCKPRRAHNAWGPSVPVNRDAGANGIPYCFGDWCCVLNHAWRDPEAGAR